MKTNDRVQMLKQDVMSRKGSFIPELNLMWRDVALYNIDKRHDMSLLQQRAANVYELIKIVPIMINPGWTLAGEHVNPPLGWQGLVWGFRSSLNENECKDELQKIGYADKFDEIKVAVKSFWTHSSATAPGVFFEDNLRGIPMEGRNEVFWSHGCKENHSIRDYALLMRCGYGGLKRKIEAELSEHSMTEADYPSRENFLRGAMYICDAGIALGKRYAELAEQMAKETSDKAEKKRLDDMAAVCRRVPEHGAENFREAVQALWFGHLITCAEDGINANSIGRLDQILYPWYKQDIESGTITRDEAVELMTELALKLYLDYDVQAMTLGGVDKDGNCSVNDLSYVILEATERFGELRDLSVRIDSNTPDEFIRACSKLVVRGGGIPFFFNDECFLKALTDRGIPLEDARDYAPIGCVELTMPGKTNPRAVSGWFNMAKCLELALFNGVDPDNGFQMGPQTGDLDNFANFDEFYQAYWKQVEFFSERMIYHCRRGELYQREFQALPGWSLLTDDCITRGRDITDGGALYHYHSICLMGVPDVADALAAVKKFIYEDKSVSTGEMLTALQKNFEGFESLRQKFLSGVPKYGNNADEPDQLAADLCSRYIDLMDSWSVPDNRLFVHLFTFKINLNFGKTVGALPDGRLAGEPLAYSLSAHQGRDMNGLTALFNSLAKMPHNKAAAGSAAIIDLHPSMIPDGDSPELLVQLMKSAIKLGIGQIQWNVVSAERLEQARRDPEHYGNIPVRVAGYSQLFKLIEPELQEHIIARHKHQD